MEIGTVFLYMLLTFSFGYSESERSKTDFVMENKIKWIEKKHCPGNLRVELYLYKKLRISKLKELST